MGFHVGCAWKQVTNAKFLILEVRFKNFGSSMLSYMYEQLMKENFHATIIIKLLNEDGIQIQGVPHWRVQSKWKYDFLFKLLKIESSQTDTRIFCCSPSNFYDIFQKETINCLSSWQFLRDPVLTKAFNYINTERK